MAPVIGITAYAETARWGPWDQLATLIPQDYVAMVQAAGAHAVVLPAEPDPSEVVSRLDGLLIAGGADLDATSYGQEPHPTNDVPRTDRDAHELAAYRAARAAGIPVLGICRGIQVMAVAHGGTLVQHLPDLVGDTHRPAPGAFSTHGARFADGSLVARLLGTTTTEVNSSHHQAVDQPGDGLIVTGRADDGTVEACEDPTVPFVLGVQWHPEVLSDPALFLGLAEAADRPRIA